MPVVDGFKEQCEKLGFQHCRKMAIADVLQHQENGTFVFNTQYIKEYALTSLTGTTVYQKVASWERKDVDEEETVTVKTVFGFISDNGRKIYIGDGDNEVVGYW